jgi:protein gp37
MRFGNFVDSDGNPFIVEGGKFTGQIKTHPERLSTPLKRRKPTVFAVWNDLFHETVPPEFTFEAFAAMRNSQQHIFLVLTKRPQNINYDYFEIIERCIRNVYLGLTICAQAEADEKIPVFLEVPGKRFLSIEPMLGPIDLQYSAFNGADSIESLEGIHAVILGGETGPGARPMHPDWVRYVRDQCAAAGVAFFLKGWGKHLPDLKDCFGKEVVSPYSALAWDVKRILDGRTHDELPWVNA